MPRILPPGVSEQKLADALHAFSEIVGEKWVSTDDAELEKYADPYPVGDKSGPAASAVVYPSTVEEVPQSEPYERVIIKDYCTTSHDVRAHNLNLVTSVGPYDSLGH